VSEVPGAPRQFEIWWARLPEPVGRRPLLLLGRSAAFAYLDRLLVVEVTTTVRGIPQEVRLVKLDAIRTVPRGCLVSKAGAISIRRQVEVKRALGHVLHWPELSGL